MRFHPFRAACFFSLCAMVAWSMIAPTPSGALPSGGHGPSPEAANLQRAGTRRAVPGELSTAQQRALDRGYLVSDEAGYAKEKARANAGRRTADAPRSSSRVPRSPAIDGAPLRSWQGVEDATGSPTDSTGAVGTTRYIEVINSKIAIYDRTNDTPLSTAGLDALTGETGHLFDPQMIWDAGTNRFYYVADNVVSATDNRLEFGFSTTASPSSTADFCKYTFSTGAEFYDYPKLGDTSNLWMVGANVFSSAGNYLRASVVGLTKPAAGSTCPTGASFTVTTASNLLHANSGSAFTPVPVNQTDPNATGWIVSAASSGTRNYMSLFSVTMNVSNQMVVAAPKTVSVATYAVPADVQQQGSTNVLDSSDTRLTNAISAIDPSRGAGTSVAIWTQHTVLGGPGAQVRWYEFDPGPATPVPFQTGTAGSSALFAFNGAISPDRRVNGANAMFGSSMMLTFNTSSTAQFVNVVAVSKRGSHGQSGLEVIKAGTEPHDDFTCVPGPCRSGDYAGASPDPASDTTKADGVVWMTNQFPGTIWHTWNFAGRPSTAPK